MSLPELRILIADDHHAFRRSPCQILAAAPEISIAAECADGATTLLEIRTSGSAVAVLDLAMPGLDGLAVARAVQRESLGCPIVILTMHDDAALVEQAQRAGVALYIRKQNVVAELVPALRRLAVDLSRESSS